MKLMTVILISSAVVLCFSLPCFSQASSFYAGAAEVNITPPIGLPVGLSGQSDGVHDSLYARILVMSGKNEKVALVNLDLGGNPDREMQDEIMANVSGSVKPDRIVYTAIHTHAGQFFFYGGEQADKKGPAWRKETIQKITDGLKLADEKRTEARVGVGFGVAYLNSNRLLVKTDGTVRWLGNGTVNFVTFPVDPAVGVIRIDDKNGAPVAILVNYSCHPVVVFAKDNTKYSADFPGAMKKYVQEHLKGNPICFYIQGASGDINPSINPTPIIENSLKLKDELGCTLGREVVRISSGIQTHAVPDAQLQTRIKEIGLKIRWDKEKMIEMAKKQYGEKVVPMIEQQYARDWKAPITFIVLKNEFGICGFPGEFYVEFQMDLRRRFTDFPLFFAGITGESFGYFPTIRAAVQGGYGSNNASTSVEVGAGEKMITEAVVELNYMTGNLTHESAPPPGKPAKR